MISRLVKRVVASYRLRTSRYTDIGDLQGFPTYTTDTDSDMEQVPESLLPPPQERDLTDAIPNSYTRPHIPKHWTR